ncbi:hypothetical protein DER30_0002 [Streptomyces sp. HB202]|nr:hypothetical protein DER30_0002 [Streptomyces sp. HB202]
MLPAARTGRRHQRLVGKFYFDDNGRVANALLVGAYAKFQVAGHQWYPLISGVLVLAVLWAVAVLALRRTGLRTPRGMPLLLAAMTTALFLFVTPNTYKTFYWPAASVSHTLPPVLACAALIPLLLARTRRGRVVAVGVAVLMAAFLATLSEETAIVVVMVLLAAVLVSGRVVPPPTGGSSACGAPEASPGRRPGPWSSSPHPGSMTRRERFGAETTSLLAPDSLAASLRAFAENHRHRGDDLAVRGRGRGRCPAGTAVPPGGRDDTPPARALAAADRRRLVTLLISRLPVHSHRLPGVPGPGERPERQPAVERLPPAVRDPARRRGRPAGPGRPPVPAAALAPAKAVCAALCVLVCVGPAISLTDLDTAMRARADKWDAQDRRLREGAAAGERVLPYERLVISQMLEPFSEGGERYWPGGCVADLYRLDRVTDGARGR